MKTLLLVLAVALGVGATGLVAPVHAAGRTYLHEAAQNGGDH